MRVAGIMSGTSLDGIDVAVVDVSGRRVTPLAFHSRPYPKAVRQALLGVSNAATQTREISRLNFLLPELYAEAFLALKCPGVQLIGCHGQTIFHEGDAARVHGRRIASTLQIGDGSVLAARTGLPVVCDFRPADMAAGGRGAPLVPFADLWLYRHKARHRTSLNIGGIANITVIPPKGEVAAFDTGPGNMVIDQLAPPFDRGGRRAARGTVDEALLNELLRDPYYRRNPPKTAGREQYGAEFVARLRARGLAEDDLIATATALTAFTIALAVGETDDLIVSGGGVHNRTLMRLLAGLLPFANIQESSAYGIDPDAKEAIAFAILAHETWHGRAANVPAATGARHPAVLGKLCRPPIRGTPPRRPAL